MLDWTNFGGIQYHSTIEFGGDTLEDMHVQRVTLHDKGHPRHNAAAATPTVGIGGSNPPVPQNANALAALGLLVNASIVNGNPTTVSAAAANNDSVAAATNDNAAATAAPKGWNL